MTQPIIRAVFVPLDGSPFAEKALPFAMEVARRLGAELQLALVHQPDRALVAAMQLPEFVAQLDQDARSREQVYLDSVAGRVAADSGVQTSTVQLTGAITDALENQIESIDADLVVITTHGRGPLSRFWLGSVADQLVRRLHRSLLVVNPGRTAPIPVIQRILVALDGSSFAEEALSPALELGRAFSASYVLLRAIEPGPPIGDPAVATYLSLDPVAEAQRKVEALRYLEEVAGRLRRQGHLVTCRVTSGQAPAPAILQQADETGSDLVALAGHGIGGFPRLVLGSVADKVIRGTNRPVLVVRPVG